ncbi:MAG: endopeptidase La [Clostridia bacterium]|nr:endopeptidase La [Clostridia bacterium]
MTRTNILPVIPLRGRVAFPHNLISFEAGREMTLKAIERASLTEDKQVLVCTQKVTEQDDIAASDFYPVGCVARIKQISRIPGGAVRVVCEGLYRARAREIGADEGYFCAVADEMEIKRGDYVLEEAYLRTAKAIVKEAFSDNGKFPKETLLKMERCQDADEYMDIAFFAMRVKLEIKQQSLEETDIVKRLQLLERCLNDELEIAKLEKKISASVRQSIDKSQKEYFLREQLKAIHTELGDNGKEEDEYRAKVLAACLPQELEVKCLKEVDRLGKMQSSAPEYTVIVNYLDQVLSLPWTAETADTESLEDCERVLEADHFGLDKIKERILEYLAVLKLTGSMKAPILCLVGPPGVGKTSIAQSIARALGRKFVRMSLGGVRDEAEIRGHRRTYIGAMPGRIMYGMKNAGSINPVFLLDEIDKITSDMHGDPAAALLEALDPEQNSTFRDRFIEYPYDLSKVLFIATANSLETIPAPLRDRMEIIELSGYTLEEKVEIGKRYLVPKQLAANGLTDEAAEFSSAALGFMVEGYTREAGVRSLERTIGSVCRKIAVKRAKNKKSSRQKVDAAAVKTLIGAPKFTIDEAALAPQVGAAVGLAWTAVGGTTLTVEAVTLSGKGEVKLTGKLGEVMKESALAALGYIRSHAEEYGIDKELFAKTDLHIHVPEGATPKDGPSAGITMATAALSAFTGAKVRGDLAMTGEITLRGKVLPIGGLKEKALAARRVGIKTVVVPQGNEKDLAGLPSVLKEEVQFLPVSDVKEVFEVAFIKEEKAKTAKPRKKAEAKPMPVLPQRNGDRDGMRCKK